MELDPYIEEIREQVALAAAAGGDEARAVAERLVGPLDAAVRLALQHALADAADQITLELAPGSVELRIRGRELAFVVSLPPTEPASHEPAAGDEPVDAGAAGATSASGDGESDMVRINLRLPDELKARVEQAARTHGLSVNAWLVRAASAALQHGATAAPPGADRRAARVGQQYRGWAK